MSLSNQRGGVDRAIVLAAGRGTRIRSRINDRPKPLIRLGGRSVLEWNLAQVARAGVCEVWINLHHLGEQIEREIGDGSRFGLQVSYCYEPELLGTAGTVLRLAAELREGPFLVVYGDNVTVCDMPGIVAFHCRKRAQLTLAVFDPVCVPNTGMAGGRLALGPDDEVRQFKEGSSGEGGMVNAGVYVVDPGIVDFIPDAIPCDFGRDAFPLMLAHRARLFGFPIGGCCLAVDTPAALDRAEILIQDFVAAGLFP